MKAVNLSPLWHRDQYCIAIQNLDDCTAAVVRNFPHRHYSKTHGCWYVSYTPATLDVLLQTLAAVREVKILQPFDEHPKSLIVSKKVKPTLPEGYRECLIRLRYSKSTCVTYEAQLLSFVKYIHPLSIGEITRQTVDEYMIYLIREKRSFSFDSEYRHQRY